MADSPSITPQQLKKFVARFQKDRNSIWLPCAGGMDRALKKACSENLPLAIVQTRAKTVSSFAEKCVRKWHKYKDPAEQLTDLCGSRIIVQLIEEVDAVRDWVKANFNVIEEDDKTQALGENQFGYRDLHFLIQLREDRYQLLGFTEKDYNTFGSRSTELQVRTLVQHSWADILHDRTYKTPLPLSQKAKRTAGLLAAILEESDLNLNTLSRDIDDRNANYSAYASKSQILDEIETQQLILKGEGDPFKKAKLASKIATLLISNGSYSDTAKLLDKLKTPEATPETLPEFHLNLGYALCRCNSPKDKTLPKDFERGLYLLERVFTFCTQPDYIKIPDRERLKAIKAKAAERLSWTYKQLAGKEKTARDYCRVALDLEPKNPYHLSNLLGMERQYDRSDSAVSCSRPQINQALETCLEHGKLGIELPYAWFCGGRLELLLQRNTDALGWYARAIRHLFTDECNAPFSQLDDEIDWIRQLSAGSEQTAGERWIVQLLELAKQINSMDTQAKLRQSRILIIAGGAASITPQQLKNAKPALTEALSTFEGTVLSGGTCSGVPGLVGEITAQLRLRNGKKYHLHGYLPKLLSIESSEDKRYDKHIYVGETGFSPDQVIRMWTDLIERGIHPASVQLLGIGGGEIAGFEYKAAIALGASIGLIQGSGGYADRLLKDPFWKNEPGLLPLPNDPSVARAFTSHPQTLLTDAAIEMLAQSAHERYVSEQSGRLPENLKNWSELPDRYKTSNIQQIIHMSEILGEQGLVLRKKRVGLKATPLRKGSKQVEAMAEREHGRWVIERLRSGWRFNKVRNNDRQLHPDLVHWNDLDEETKDWDRKAVLGWPDFLASENWIIVKKGK